MQQICKKGMRNFGLGTNNNNSVFVYRLMKEKLATMKSWIQKSNQKNTQNPLFQ